MFTSEDPRIVRLVVDVTYRYSLKRSLAAIFGMGELMMIMCRQPSVCGVQRHEEGSQSAALCAAGFAAQRPSVSVAASVRPTVHLVRPSRSIPGTPHTNPDGSRGGFVAGTARVAPTATIGPDARVEGNAVVRGTATVHGTAIDSGYQQMVAVLMKDVAWWVL